MLFVERCGGPGHLRGEGQAAARAHAPVRELSGRPRKDSPARRADRLVRVHRGGERARIARARKEPHQPVCAVFQRRLQGRQVLPVHRPDQKRRVPGHQVHAREAPRRHRVLRPVHRQPRRSHDDRRGPSRRAAVLRELRRLAPTQASPREGRSGRLPFV